MKPAVTVVLSVSVSLYDQLYYIPLDTERVLEKVYGVMYRM